LYRVISEKKRLETSSGGQGTKIRDIETEELIEDQQQKIRSDNKKEKSRKNQGRISLKGTGVKHLSRGNESSATEIQERDPEKTNRKNIRTVAQE
jgi:hypothetical protein